MKKTTLIILIALIALSSFAQEPQRKHKHYDFTAEQMAEIQTKKMTLYLDLTASQQDQIFEFNKIKATERKQKIREDIANKQNRKVVSSKEVFTKKSARLDIMIAHKAEMKRILNDEQFQKWENAQKHKIKKRIAKRKMRQKRMRR